MPESNGDIEAENEHEPHSTQDIPVDGGEDELRDVDQGSQDLAQHDISAQNSSLTSNGSQHSKSSQSLFKKIPAFNQLFAKQNKVNCLCKRCGELQLTVELSRLVGHVRKCNKLDKVEKRYYIDMYNTTVTKKLKSSQSEDHILNELWAKVMAENNFSLVCVESQSFKNFFRRSTPNWKYASRKTFSSDYIPAISNIIRDELSSLVKYHGDDFVSLEFDHWKDINGRSFLGIVFTFLSGKRYLVSLDDVSTEGHFARRIVPYVTRAIGSLSPTAINSITSDSASSCQLARELIVANVDFERIIQHRCVAHLINRMGNMFTATKNTKKTLIWASRMTALVAKSTLLSGLLREQGCKKPKKAVKTRWFSTINMVSSLLEAKEVLLESARRLPKDQQVDWMQNEARWLLMVRIERAMRPLMDCIAVAEREDGSLGESVSALLKYARALFTSDWKDPLILEAISSFLAYFGPRKLGVDEFGLMLAAYATDRRNKCDFLTEEGLDLISSTLTSISMKTGYKSSNFTKTLLEEFISYSVLTGEYSKDQPEEQTALQWWLGIRASTSLKPIAIRLARLRSSSANIERTFSTIKWIQGSRRTNLSADTLVHLTRIKIFEGDCNLTDIDLPVETEQELEDQQIPDHDDDESLLELQATDNEAPEACQHQLYQDRSRPGLLSDELQWIYDSFTEFIDFSKVNKPLGSAINIDKEMSEEDRDKLVRDSSETRRKLRDQLHSQCSQRSTA